MGPGAQGPKCGPAAAGPRSNAMDDRDLSEQELLGFARQGDDRAFESLMRLHSGAIRNLIAHYFPNRTTVDDLAQETYVKAYFALPAFRGESPFVFWLKQIAVRLCLDEMRRRKNSEFRQEEENPVQAVKDPGRQIEARLLLRNMLSRLSPLDRIILVLLHGEGYEIKEIAQMTGLSRANIKIRAFRLRKQLRALYPGVVK
jgi:RNA polymerase sigma-70 factor, ECF subfamily